jgi:ribosomal-protein-alanine N-acetyltransferase
MDIPVDISQITLETPRLTLRPWQEADLADFYAYASVPGVGEMAGWPHHSSREVSQEILEDFIEKKDVFALALRETGQVIGSLGFHYAWANGEPAYENLVQKEIGYVLSKDHWGKGLMPEAVKAALSFSFTDLRLDAVTVAHATGNNQSRRVIEKCGFRFVKYGVYQARLLHETRESAQYILEKKDWLQARL